MHVVVWSNVKQNSVDEFKAVMYYLRGVSKSRQGENNNNL